MKECENEIIASVCAGNTRAFARLVDKYQDMAFSIALRILQNQDDAQEAVQDAFLKAFNGLKSFRNDAKFSTWFYKIVYHTAISHSHKQMTETVYEDYGPADSIPTEYIQEETSSLERQDRKRIIETILQKMNRDESLILTLFYLEETTVDEISAITGWSQSNVKVKLFRSRKRFYELLKVYLKSESHILI